MAASIISESDLWKRIDDAEGYLVSGMFEQAASLASSTIQCLHTASLEKAVDDSLFAEMNEVAGMIYVQSLKELARTSELFVQLKELYGSLASVPVKVFVTGASMQIAEGSGSNLKASFQEYLAKWRYTEGQVYVLTGAAEDSSSNGFISMSFMSAEEYLEVAELYTITFLGVLSHETEVAISWTEKAELAEEDRQDLLRRLEALQSAKNKKASTDSATKQSTERSLSASTTGSTPSSLDDSPKTMKYPYMPNVNKLKESSLKSIQPSVQHAANRIDPFFWWFHSVRIKLGKVQFVLPSGKLMLFFSLLFSTFYILRRRSADLKRMAVQRASSLRRSLIDAWRLAFSVQMNPLAAVQQLPQAPRGSW